MGGEEHPREVYVSQEVHDVVCGPWPPGREGDLHANLRGLLDSFTEGDFITVGQDPFNKAGYAILARVHPVSADVWDIRCLDPNPGIRAFGCFYEADSLVVLTWSERDLITDWAAEVQNCLAEWRKYCGNREPLRGRTINDYLSFNFRVV
jgi:hypothetical protein